MKPIKSYSFNCYVNGNNIHYKIKHTDKPVNELNEYEYNDNQFINLINKIKYNQKFYLTFFIILGLLCLTTTILLANIVDKTPYVIVTCIILGLNCFAILFYIGLSYVAGNDGEISYYQEIEELYILSKNGKIQQIEQEMKYKNEKDKILQEKANDLINIYDNLDSQDKDRETKIKLISEILNKYIEEK